MSAARLPLISTYSTKNECSSTTWRHTLPAATMRRIKPLYVFHMRLWKKHNTCPCILTHGFSLVYIRTQSILIFFVPDHLKLCETQWKESSHPHWHVSPPGGFVDDVISCRHTCSLAGISRPCHSPLKSQTNKPLWVLNNVFVQSMFNTALERASLCSCEGSEGHGQTSRAEVLTGLCVSRTCSIASHRTCGCKRRAAAPDSTSWNDLYRSHLHRETMML